MTYFGEKSSEAATLEQLVARLKEIQLGLKQNLANLNLRLGEFYSRPELSVSAESFKKEVESRAISLEEEVKQLREELTSIKDLLDLKFKENKSVGS